MEQPPLDDLKNRALPGAGAALQKAKSAILARWLQEVRSILQKFDELTRKQLEDSLPDLLDRIAAALASTAPATTDQLIAIAPKHGSERFHQAFSLNQLLIEYHVLRRIVLEEIAAALGRQLSITENIAVNQGLDIAVRQSAVEYADQQTAALNIETAATTKFLSFLSHDLRGGLNGAVLMIEVLKRELDGEDKFSSAIEDLDLLRRSMLETVSTMERFLDAEKLRHGQMPVKVAPVEVTDLLSEFQKSFGYLLRDTSIEMEIDVKPAKLSISTDRQLLAMSLQNLISNAIKYGGRGKVRVCALGGEKAPPGVMCRFTVKDDGPGIAKEKLTEIFSPFARGESYGQKGVGLGLFIARQATDLLHAKMWAESEPGQGTIFYLDLPPQDF